MSKLCTNCGAALDDDAVFCPECGTRTDAAPAPEEKPAAEAPAPAPAPAPGPAPQPAPGPAPETRSKEISTAGYFWLMLLFAIPVIGLIALLIFAFAVKNKNLRNFARAILIWIIVALVLSVIAFILMKIFGVDLSSVIESIENVIPL